MLHADVSAHLEPTAVFALEKSEIAFRAILSSVRVVRGVLSIYRSILLTFQADMRRTTMIKLTGIRLPIDYINYN
jgi:hypothetical protein